MTEGWRRRLGILAVAIVAMTLAGCATEELREEQRQERDARANVYPGNFRADVVAALHVYLSDPAHVRDAWVSDPAVTQIGDHKRYAACVRFSARDDDGRYAARTVLAVFSGGRFDHFVEASASDDAASQKSLSALMKGRCDTANYRRFPELEALKR